MKEFRYGVYGCEIIDIDGHKNRDKPQLSFPLFVGTNGDITQGKYCSGMNMYFYELGIVRPDHYRCVEFPCIPDTLFAMRRVYLVERVLDLFAVDGLSSLENYVPMQKYRFGGKNMAQNPSDKLVASGASPSSGACVPPLTKAPRGDLLQIPMLGQRGSHLAVRPSVSRRHRMVMKGGHKGGEAHVAVDNKEIESTKQKKTKSTTQEIRTLEIVFAIDWDGAEIAITYPDHALANMASTSTAQLGHAVILKPPRLIGIWKQVGLPIFGVKANDTMIPICSTKQYVFNPYVYFANAQRSSVRTNWKVFQCW